MFQGVSAINAISFKYKDGIIAAIDTGSVHGSTNYPNTQRIFKITDNCIGLFTGNLSDIDFLKSFIKREIDSEEFRVMDPQGIHKMVQRILYQKRSEGAPLPISVIICGINKKENTIFENTDAKGRMIGAVNSKGNFWFDSSIALSFSTHMNLPMLRNYDSDSLEKEQALALAEECLRVMCYKDCRATNVIQIAIFENGVLSIGEPYGITTDWMIGLMEGEVLLSN